MKTILLFGASGNLGKEIAREARQQGYDLTVVVRNKSKAAELSAITEKSIVADVTQPAALTKICQGYDVVISALGKSVSLNDKSKPSFKDIDLNANTAIVQEALKSGVKKFIYVSALHSEKYPHLDYFNVHHDLSEKLKNSGMDHTIIKPTAIFSAFIDLMAMAKKGQLITMGAGDKKTNPIYEGDLAAVCVNAIKQPAKVVEAGGQEVYTRKQINEIIQAGTAPHKKVRTVPLGFVKLSLPLMKLFDKNAYDKIAFFMEVLQHDTIAPKLGKMTLEEYVKMKNGAKA